LFLSTSINTQSLLAQLNLMFTMVRQSPKNYLLATVLFLLLVPAISHLLFSWMGMTPTDDGFNLAMSRRLLEGEIPHRDFITPRPAGTEILYAPLVLLGGDYTIWISRFFVWFQFACIAWIWTTVIGRLPRRPLGMVEQMALALMVFALTAHNFLLTPWPTIDGLWIASVGLPCCLSPRPFRKFAGYFMVGAACLFKQNFIILGPVFLIMLEDWRRLRYWVAVALPPACYVILLGATGALSDARLQLTAHSELFQTGIRAYLLERWSPYAGLIAAYFGLLIVSGTAKTQFFSFPSEVRFCLGVLGVSLVAVAAAACLMTDYASLKFSFALFGMLAGTLLYYIFHQNEKDAVVRIGILVMAVMWSTSISLGWNFPVFGSGMAVALFAIVVRLVLPADVPAKRYWNTSAWIISLAAITLICFGVGRSRHIYKERPASELRCSLDGILPGGRLIWTNPVTFEYMKELHEAIEQAGGQEYAVIPDAAIHWVKSLQRNPLPIDWPHDMELSNPALLDRVIQALESRRGRIVILVAKVTGFSLGDKPKPLSEAYPPYPTYNKVAPYVASHFHKIGEMQYWEIYK
jgi:hypothetical protein